MKTSRLCALCDKVIDDRYIVCAEHMPDYIAYKDEEWFKMLVMSQRTQFQIDITEEILKSGNVKYTKPYRKLSDSEKTAIQYLRYKGLGARNIGKILGIHYRTVSDYMFRKSIRKP